MGNQIGIATKVDEATASHRHFARVCFEVDLDKPLVPCVRLMGRIQHVKYGGLHVICFRYSQYGHQNKHCTIVKPSIGTQSRRRHLLLGWGPGIC